jgi:hypothetical protein
MPRRSSVRTTAAFAGRQEEGALARAPPQVGNHGSSRSARIKKMLAVANKQHANDGGDNHTKYGAWYGKNGVAWCVFPDGHFDTIEGNAGPNTDRVVHGVRGGSGDAQRGTYYFWTAIRP